MKVRFDVFLCHNSEDKSEVKNIGSQLIEEGLRPWLDEWELRPGVSWQRLLDDSIDKINAAAVFIGPSGIGPWQRMEMEAYLRDFVKRECPVIPVIMKGVSKTPKLPLFLGNLTWVDFRQNEQDSLERLIWGITGERRGSGVTPLSEQQTNWELKSHLPTTSIGQLFTSVPVQWPLWIAGFALIAVVSIGLFLTHVAPDPQQGTPQTSSLSRVAVEPGAQDLESQQVTRVPVHITVQPSYLPASVYGNGVFLSKTPFKEYYEVGEKLRFVLSRNGYEDYPVEVTVNPTENYYMYQLNPIRGH